MSVAVSIDSVSKRFRLNSGKPRSVKERVIHPGRRKIEDFWALRDISFDIDEGETLGLLGHNGSGKSTLLKLVGGIMQPTTGLIRVRGRLASLLELGAGFHPELTGRENVYMNAAVLGLKRVDIEKRFDDIVEFAELERFIDQQVKHYSSGMYVRLGSRSRSTSILTCCSSTRCSPSATRPSSASASTACTSSRTRAARSSSCRTPPI